jgi:uncharacterized membrane protein
MSTCSIERSEGYPMIQIILTITLWFCCIGSGLIAGVFFAFSAFIMKAFSRISEEHGASAMQSINSTILGSPFMPIFFGTALGSLVLAGVALFRWAEPGEKVILAAGATYFVGMFLCTVVFNVPLNNALASVDLSSAEAAVAWHRYLKEWTFWNHARTAASVVACGLFIWAIAAQ